MLQRPAYSFVDDPNVPPFEGGAHFNVMDAHCGLCARAATWIARNDGDGKFKIIPLQSDLGQALMRHYGLDPDDPTSWLYVEEGHGFDSLDAFIRVGLQLGGIWRIMAVLRLLPRRLQNALYGLVARNRYRFFGGKDLCALPDPDVQRRLLLG